METSGPRKHYSQYPSLVYLALNRGLSRKKMEAFFAMVTAFEADFDMAADLLKGLIAATGPKSHTDPWHGEHDRTRPTTYEELQGVAMADPRIRRVLASVDWGDITPTMFCWELLVQGLKGAMDAQALRELKDRGITKTRLLSGCELYRIDAWDHSPPSVQPAAKPAAQKKKRKGKVSA